MFNMIVIATIVAAIITSEIWNLYNSNKYGCVYMPWLMSVAIITTNYIKYAKIQKNPMAYLNWQNEYSKAVIKDKAKYKESIKAQLLDKGVDAKFINAVLENMSI